MTFHQCETKRVNQCTEESLQSCMFSFAFSFFFNRILRIKQKIPMLSPPDRGPGGLGSGYVKSRDVLNHDGASLLP